jgi:hypothetical protein
VAECLTEDYEIGLLVTHLGGKARFLRLRDETGELIATRSYFPTRWRGRCGRRPAGFTASRCRAGTAGLDRAAGRCVDGAA